MPDPHAEQDLGNRFDFRNGAPRGGEHVSSCAPSEVFPQHLSERAAISGTVQSDDDPAAKRRHVKPGPVAPGKQKWKYRNTGVSPRRHSLMDTPHIENGGARIISMASPEAQAQKDVVRRGESCWLLRRTSART